MDELNIRAAKALMWRQMSTDILMYMPPEDILKKFNVLYTTAVSGHHESMHFTSSWDWTMLGVNKLRFDSSSVMWDEFLGKFMHDLPMFITSKPEQITKAWVEVLENE